MIRGHFHNFSSWSFSIDSCLHFRDKFINEIKTILVGTS
nr:MAG TPA: TOLL LIKE RECEPTOR 10, IL-1, TOLL, TLR10, MEMBRANE.2A [Caudoviricetes sp.]